jgi:hypothetical protein
VNYKDDKVWSSHNKQFLINELVWISISLVISFPSTISNIISSYCSNFFATRLVPRRKRLIATMAGSVVAGIFSALSLVDDSLKYYFMSGRTSHKQIACSSYSSMKRLGLSTHLNAGKKRSVYAYR